VSEIERPTELQLLKPVSGPYCSLVTRSVIGLALVFDEALPPEGFLFVGDEYWDALAAAYRRG
jgi:hypothetical protein